MRYNFLITILLIGSTATNSYAQSCKELVDSVFAIETKLKTTTLPACSTKANITEDCCSKGDPDSCLNLNQIELDYNKALAEVNIYESLLAIGQSAVNDHRTIKSLSQKELASAKELIEKFDKSIKKRDLVNSALEIDKVTSKDAKTLWHGYTADNKSDLLANLTDKCKTAALYQPKADEKKPYRDFCGRLPKLEEDEVDTLYNFYLSQQSIESEDTLNKIGDIVPRFEEYSKYLAIKVDDKIVSGSFEGTKHYKEYIELKDLLKSDKQPTEAEAIKILSKASSLSKVSIDMDDIKFSDQDSFAGRFQKDVVSELKTNILQTESSTSILTNQSQILKNIKNADQSMDLELRAKEDVVRQMLTESDRLSNACPKSKSLHDCALTICGENYNQEKVSCSNSSFQNIGSVAIASQISKVEQSRKLKAAHKKITDCVSKRIPQERDKCIKEADQSDLKLTSNNLSDAKQRLEKANNLLSLYLKKEPFNKLTGLKNLNLAALDEKGCIGEKDKEQSEKIESYCKTPLLDGHITNVLNLESSASKITLKMKFDLEKGYYKKQFGDHNFGSNLNYANEVCKKQFNEKLAVCDYMQAANETRKQKLVEAQNAEKLKVQKQITREENFYAGWQEENEGPTAFESGLTGLATGAAQGMPQIFGMIQQKRQHDRQMDYYQSLYNYRQRTYDSNYTNYQPQYYWNNFQDPMTFNAAPTAMIDMSGFNYNFQTIPSSLSNNNAQSPVFTSPAPASIPGTGSNLGFDFGN